MNIKWYSNKHDDKPTGVSSSYQIIEKFLGNDPDSKKASIYLIISEKLDINSFFSKLMTQVNIYKKFNLNIGILENEDISEIPILDKPTFFIGDQCHFDALLKIPTEKILISNRIYDGYSNIGYQRHLSEIPLKPSVSLGALNDQMDLAESLLRKADTIMFDLKAIRRNESGIQESGICGLSTIEACNLSRSAGLSKNQRLFFINTIGHQINNDQEEIISTILWYYLEGVLFRDIENEHKNSSIYFVENDLFDEPIKFIKGKSTGRWSFVHPYDGKVYPCTNQDYIEMSKGHVPDCIVSMV